MMTSTYITQGLYYYMHIHCVHVCVCVCNSNGLNWSACDAWSNALQLRVVHIAHYHMQECVTTTTTNHSIISLPICSLVYTMQGLFPDFARGGGGGGGAGGEEQISSTEIIILQTLPLPPK